MLERVAGLQAQEPRDPYVALFARVKGFKPEALERALARRQAVRMALMRSTIHLVTARDAVGLRPLVQPVIQRSTLGSHGRRLADVPHAKVAQAGQVFLRGGPRTFSDVGRHLHGLWPRSPAADLAQLFRALVPLVQVPPRGYWSASGTPLVLPMDEWLLGTSPTRLDAPGLVRRYLAAFGPASVADAQAWSGLTRLQAAFDALGDARMTFSSPSGTRLYDLPRSPRPDGDMPAPPRFLPVYDNAILGYRDRSRILPGTPPDLDLRQNESVRFVLLDGVLGATWRSEIGKASAVAVVKPFVPLGKDLKSAVREEGEALLSCLYPDGEVAVRFD